MSSVKLTMEGRKNDSENDFPDETQPACVKRHRNVLRNWGYLFRLRIFRSAIGRERRCGDLLHVRDRAEGDGNKREK